MPAASRAQQKWAFGVKGPAWARKHHFDTKGKLPARAPARTPKRDPQDERARLAEAFRKRGKRKQGRARGA
jgi:hypothetical protein